MVELMPSHRPPPLISEYVEGHRVMPTDTPFPGRWKNSHTPYLVEIMDNMSPYSPVIETDAMKGAQWGLTAGSENVMGYWMDANPTSILYVSSTQEMLEKWANKRLEPMISSLGFRHKMSMVEVLENSKSRRGGDRAMSKQFMGGSLDMASSQSLASLQSDTKRVLIVDELDRAPIGLGKENWIDNAKARTNAWGNRAKILCLSTPITEEASLIYARYLRGDRRKWYMPCPFCGKEQHLSLTLEEFPRRFFPVRDEGGHVIDVELLCEHCAGIILGSVHKRAMVMAGHWVPEGPAMDLNTRSYHGPTAISLMMTWPALYAEYEKVKDSPSAVRSFVNLYLGLPFREAGRKPKIDNTAILRGAYKAGTVPMGVIYLTAGIDVQTGKDARLEVAVWGHGMEYKTWLIDYIFFEGPTDIPKAGAWKKLDDWARDGGLVYKRGDRAFPIQLVFVDEGDGNVSATVRQVAASWHNTYSCKGERSIQSHEKKAIEGDRAGSISEVSYRRSQVGNSGQHFYRVGTNHYKRIIYQNLEIPREGSPDEGLPQRSRFMDFPSNIEELNLNFFPQLLGEELREDGSYHPVTANTRVEALDCTVYAFCAGDVWLHEITNRLRDVFKREHPEVSMTTIVENITPLTVLRDFAVRSGIPVE
jgi:phage terminase large subunit GpA-like protein